MCEDWFDTFQAFYISVKKTRFKIISKSKRSIKIILDNEISAFTRTTLPFWNLRSSLRAATDDKDTRQLLNVFNMVSVPETSSWLDSRRNSELENLEMMAEIVFFFGHCHRWAGQCVVRAHSCSQEWLKPQLFWCRKLPFAFSHRWGVIISSGYCTRESSLLFLVGFIVIVKGLYASVACDLHNIWAFNVRCLQLADCCLSWTVIRELFVTFFKASTRHNCFHHVATGGFYHWLSFEPDVVIQSSVSFDTKVEWNRPLHV